MHCAPKLISGTPKSEPDAILMAYVLYTNHKRDGRNNSILYGNFFGCRRRFKRDHSCEVLSLDEEESSSEAEMEGAGGAYGAGAAAPVGAPFSAWGACVSSAKSAFYLK